MVRHPFFLQPGNSRAVVAWRRWLCAGKNNGNDATLIFVHEGFILKISRNACAAMLDSVRGIGTHKAAQWRRPPCAPANLVFARGRLPTRQQEARRPGAAR
ncbi:MAG: hypothetical protein EBS01_05655 [Verrucomicrobia bacterium]|nr:hypothetical protein [Verrucomicrobiota bacterium]